MILSRLLVCLLCIAVGTGGDMETCNTVPLAQSTGLVTMKGWTGTAAKVHFPSRSSAGKQGPNTGTASAAAKDARCCAAGCVKRPSFLISPPSGIPNATDPCSTGKQASSQRDARFFCAQHAPVAATALKSPSQLCRWNPALELNASREMSQVGADTGADSGRGWGCTRWPSYGDPVQRRVLFCRQHAAPGHVNLKARKCRARGCTRQATYGAAPDGEGMPTGKALFCLQHKGTLLCSKHARAREGGRLPPFTHRTTLVRLGQRTCGVSGCSTVANFGQELPDGSCFRRRCLVHKSPEDLDLTRRICSVTGCSRRSAARPLSAGKAGLGGHEQLCLQHAHVNLPVRRMAGRREGKKRGGFMAGDEPCVFPVTGGCRARAEYGDDENGVALFCEEHRAAYHVHVGRSSRWGSAEGDGFVSSKRKRAGLVRRLYALAADVPIAEDTGAWLWGAGEEARLRELERDRAVEAEMEFFVGAQEERLEQNRVSGAQEHES